MFIIFEDIKDFFQSTSIIYLLANPRGMKNPLFFELTRIHAGIVNASAIKWSVAESAE